MEAQIDSLTRKIHTLRKNGYQYVIRDCPTDLLNSLKTGRVLVEKNPDLVEKMVRNVERSYEVLLEVVELGKSLEKLQRARWK